MGLSGSSPSQFLIHLRGKPDRFLGKLLWEVGRLKVEGPLAAARQGTSMAALIQESLELRDILPLDAAQEIVAQARSSPGLSDEEATAIAVHETRLYRAGQDD